MGDLNHGSHGHGMPHATFTGGGFIMQINSSDGLLDDTTNAPAYVVAAMATLDPALPNAPTTAMLNRVLLRAFLSGKIRAVEDASPGGELYAWVA